LNAGEMADDGAIVLSAVGDIGLHGQYGSAQEERGSDFFFDHVRPTLTAADVTFGNLECVLTNSTASRRGKLCLKGAPSFAAALRGAGLTVLSVANNHSFDYGADGYREMLQHLGRMGIQTVGAGDSLAEARRPVEVVKDGLRVVFLAYCDASTNGLNEAREDAPGVAPLRWSLIVEDIAVHRQTADAVVVSLHWGEEFSTYPSADQVELARRLVDAGVSLVVGHHGHTLKGIERYKGAVIAYDLGSLMLSDIDWHGSDHHYVYRKTERDRRSVVLTCRLSRGGVESVELVPIRLNDELQPEPAGEGLREIILREVAELSAPLASADYAAFWESHLLQREVRAPLARWWRNGTLRDKIQRFEVADLRRAMSIAATVIRLKVLGKGH
jgi:hypothetical protein